MTKEQIIAELKAQYPTLTYGINDEFFEMTDEQYEETIISWANAKIAKEQAKLEAQALLKTKVLAYQKMALTNEEIGAILGLTADDLKALGLG